MQDKSSIVAIYAEHVAAEAALRKIAEDGFDLKQFSIIGKGYHTEEQVVGFYSAGDRIRFWGSRGLIWGGLWGLLFGGLMLTVPVVGPVMVLGHLAALVFTAVSGAAEGAVVLGGMGAIGAAFFSIGIPPESVLKYDQSIRADDFLVVGHGPADDMARARDVLVLSGPRQIDTHAIGAHAALAAA